MRALLKGIAGQLPPFMFLSAPGVTSKEQRAASELWMRDRQAASLTERDGLSFPFDLAHRDKIKIAYLSNDFQNHATSMLLIEMFEAHDRARFETHAFSFGGADSSQMRQRLQNTFHTFHDVSALSDVETAQAIHAAGIDILVDLKGYTAGARTNVMMLHPAPVQVNYLGYPGTLGGDICDYIITDSYVTPIATAADYSESFAYMPHSYQPHGRTAEIGRKPSLRPASFSAVSIRPIKSRRRSSISGAACWKKHRAACSGCCMPSTRKAICAPRLSRGGSRRIA
jgi:predicted O-linked N-acetylglucosamine transferase (SPINDLY family)